MPWRGQGRGRGGGGGDQGLGGGCGGGCKPRGGKEVLGVAASTKHSKTDEVEGLGTEVMESEGGYGRGNFRTALEALVHRAVVVDLEGKWANLMVEILLKMALNLM